MALTKLEIANRALDLIGAVPLNSVDQDNDTARIISRNYEVVLLRLLRKFPWPFALKRTTLSPDPTAPVNEFSYQFPLPASYLRMDQVYPESMIYRIEAGADGLLKLYSDEASVIIRYVSQDSLVNTYQFDNGFAEYFAHELAVAISFSITDSLDLRRIIQADAKMRFQEATAIDSQEFPEVEMDEGPWINSFQYNAGNTGNNYWW